MIALAALVLTLHPWPQRDNAAFPQAVHEKLIVRGEPDATVSLRGTIDDGWIVSFCTPRFCAPRHADVKLSRNGTVVVDLQAVRTDDAAKPRATVVVESSDTRVSAAVRLRLPATRPAER